MTSTIEFLSEEEIMRTRDREAGFGALRTERGALPLEAMRVDAKIDGLVAEVEVRQTFINTIGEPMEATYIFPLPDRGAVTRFQMEVAGRVIHGIIEERQQARERYDRAIAQGHRAAITEEERAGVFTMRVGNIMPGERATVQLTLTGPLPYDQGEATFRFPLVVAPRYIPGAPLGGGDVGKGVALDTDAVPDASRITPPVLLPGFPNPIRLELRAELRGQTSRLRSSLHAIVEREGQGVSLVEIHPGERLDRDFILRFAVGGDSEAERADAVRTSLLLTPDATDDEGSFLLTLVPPAHLSRSNKPRDVVFVLDRSGSMGGWKMVAARRAVARMVDTLRDRDRFTVAAFDDQIETPPDFGAGLVDGTDRNRFRAVEFLSGIEARGGTEMAQPLDRAATQLAGGYQDRERAIVLVTDGQVGNEDQILRLLGGKIRNVRIFCVGIDQAVNAAFLKRLADLGGGLAELVESEDRLDEVMDRIHRRIGTPVLTELSLRGQDLDIDPRSIAPHRLPDLFAGAPVLIGGRYRGRAGGAVHLAGSDAGGRAWSDTVPGRTSASAAVTTIWARARVRDLEDRYVLSRDSSLEREIVSTSLRFSVLCRFTAFVAVDEAERVNAGGHLRDVMQPVDAPAGWDMFRGGAGGGAIASNAPLPAAPAAVAKKARMRRSEVYGLDRKMDKSDEVAAYDDFAECEAEPEPARRVLRYDQAPRDLGKREEHRARDATELLLSAVRASGDPSEQVRLLAAGLPQVIEALRARGADEAKIQALEVLLVELAHAIVGAQAHDDDLAALVTRALELLRRDTSARPFWK